MPSKRKAVKVKTAIKLETDNIIRPGDIVTLKTGGIQMRASLVNGQQVVCLWRIERSYQNREYKSQFQTFRYTLRKSELMKVPVFVFPKPRSKKCRAK